MRAPPPLYRNVQLSVLDIINELKQENKQYKDPEFENNNASISSSIQQYKNGKYKSAAW